MHSDIPASFEARETVNGVREWRLTSNGLTVLTCPTPVAPVVTFSIVYRVGSRHECTGHTGATHILEHLMFKGSKGFNRERGREITDSLHRVGAIFNASTWFDRTNYYATLAVEHLPLAVEIEADRMRGALVRDEDLESERTVVLDELGQGDSDPGELLWKGAFAHGFLEHPYHHPTIGWLSDVEGVSSDVLRGFYDAFYHPNNATIIVAGDVEEAAVLAEIERRFLHIPPSPSAIPEVCIREGRQRGERRFQLHGAGEVGRLNLAWHIPHALHADLPALSVLAQVLSAGIPSRLYQRLVDGNRCLSVSMYPVELHDPGLLYLSATPAPGVSHAEVEELIRQEIRVIQHEPPSDEELTRSKVKIRTDMAFQMEAPSKISNGLTEAIAMGDWRHFLREQELIARVTRDDLCRVAATYLQSKNLTVGWFLPEGEPAAATGAGTSDPKTGLHLAPAGRPCYLHEPYAERVSLSRLSGGGNLAVLRNPHAPTVTISGSLQAGMAYEADSRFSVATMAAAMLERGTSRHSRLQLARELEDNGLQLGINASLSSPTTVFFSTNGLAEQLPRLLSLLFEVLRTPTFPEEEVEKLKRRAIGGLLREQQETYPQAFNALTRHLYPVGYPQRRRTVEERLAEVRTLSREDFARFHAAAYSADSLVLAVVGNVQPQQVHSLVEEQSGSWQSRPGRAHRWLQPPAAAAGEIRIEIPDRPAIDVILGQQGLLRVGEDDYASAMLANACLGSSSLTSRLGKVVRDREGLTYGISSRFIGTLIMPGPWAVHFTCSSDNLSRAVELSRSVIADYLSTGPGEEELADERQAQAGLFHVGLATNASLARRLAMTMTAGLPICRLDEYPGELRAATKEQVLTALRRHVRPEELTLSIAGSL